MSFKHSPNLLIGVLLLLLLFLDISRHVGGVTHNNPELLQPLCVTRALPLCVRQHQHEHGGLSPLFISHCAARGRPALSRGSTDFNTTKRLILTL